MSACETEQTMIVTGANGFIGSNLVQTLQRRGAGPVLCVDDYSSIRGGEATAQPPAERRYAPTGPGPTRYLDWHDLPAWLEQNDQAVEAVFHLGACSDTTVTDRDFLMEVNTRCTQTLWHWCAAVGKPLIYASSAATYGDGALGYDDAIDPARYRPLNLYGESKQAFDLWALEQAATGKPTPPRWAGLKYFNVYGPHEGHKGRMASVAKHAFEQASSTGRVRLFQSHKPGIPDGGQRRDFIFVGDAVEVTLHLLQTPPSADAPNGLYNVGTGEARTFEDLARAVFAAMNLPPRIDYIPMPEDLRGKYQYFTQARSEKLRTAGYTKPFHSLEAGVANYVRWLGARG